MSEKFVEFLKVAIRPENWEKNPILRDYMTVEMVGEIESIIDELEGGLRVTSADIRGFMGYDRGGVEV